MKVILFLIKHFIAIVYLENARQTVITQMNHQTTMKGLDHILSLFFFITF